MTGSAASAIAGVPMSWEQFLALPDDARAEYADGRAYVNPPPSYAHQRICLRLRDLLVSRLGGRAVIVLGVGWRLPGGPPRLRIPDLMVLHGEPSGDLVTDAPPVVVEVLSSNRGDDLVRKSTEYLRAGAGQYWIVDPRDRVVDVYARTEAGWDHLAQLSDAAGEATFPTPFGELGLSLSEILG